MDIVKAMQKRGYQVDIHCYQKGDYAVIARSAHVVVASGFLPTMQAAIEEADRLALVRELELERLAQ